MKTSELIKELNFVLKEYGDLEVRPDSRYRIKSVNISLDSGKDIVGFVDFELEEKVDKSVKTYNIKQ